MDLPTEFEEYFNSDANRNSTEMTNAINELNSSNGLLLNLLSQSRAEHEVETWGLQKKLESVEEERDRLLQTVRELRTENEALSARLQQELRSWPRTLNTSDPSSEARRSDDVAQAFDHCCAGLVRKLEGTVVGVAAVVAFQNMIREILWDADLRKKRADVLRLQAERKALLHHRVRSTPLAASTTLPADQAPLGRPDRADLADEARSDRRSTNGADSLDATALPRDARS